jgi:hypothetical protein
MQGFHAIVAMQRNEPHWMLSDADARRYGTALANALRHMPIKAAQKSLDYMVLAFVVFEMETPRIAKSMMLHRQAQQPARPQAVVYPFPSASPAESGPAMMAEPPAEPAQ